MVEAHAAGRLEADRDAPPVSDELRAAVAPVSSALGPDLPVEKVVGALEAWATVIGAISLEVFGHWRNTVLDPARFFDATVRDVGGSLGLR